MTSAAPNLDLDYGWDGRIPVNAGPQPSPSAAMATGIRPPSPYAMISLLNMRARLLMQLTDAIKRRCIHKQPHIQCWQGWRHVTVGEPSQVLSAEHDSMLNTRPRQLHDEPRSCGNQPAHQRMIDLRAVGRRMVCQGAVRRLIRSPHRPAWRLARRLPTPRPRSPSWSSRRWWRAENRRLNDRASCYAPRRPSTPKEKANGLPNRSKCLCKGT
jgi:hypothetical protein